MDNNLSDCNVGKRKNRNIRDNLFVLGYQNDKLPLVSLANASAHIAVKVSGGISERKTITNSILQGTVWAGMLCTSTMD